MVLRFALSSPHPLENRGDALAAADAEAHQPVARPAPLHLVHDLDGEDGPRPADRGAERGRGFRPASSALRRLATAAGGSPSIMPLALPDVVLPSFLKAGRSFDSASI